jgi:hydrogenase nickel incorporation protein HypA/HybF
MHEVALMEEALRMAVETAKSAGSQRITCLRLRIGTMSGAVPEAMQFAFDIVSRETIAESARFEIETVTATCWCARCGKEFPYVDFLNECPDCHGMSSELRRGRELEIAEVETN